MHAADALQLLLQGSSTSVHECTQVSHAALLFGALLIMGTCTASQHLVCLCCVQLIGHTPFQASYDTEHEPFMLCCNCLSLLSAAERRSQALK